MNKVMFSDLDASVSLTGSVMYGSNKAVTEEG